MKKIVFLCPFFGKLPKHTQLWLNSCAYNEKITWILITDDKTTFKYPKNVKVLYSTLDKERERYQNKFNFKISLPDTYKLGDYKPLFGYLYEEIIKEYDFWGHVDVADVIYGDISKFINEDLLSKYDKIMFYGHFCLYKNSTEVNRRFMNQKNYKIDFKKIFSSEEFFNFEEFSETSISKIYFQNKWDIGRIDEHIADISSLYYPFILARWTINLDKIKYFKKNKMIFLWKKGELYGYHLENNNIIQKEYLYVHFKRRNMSLEIKEEEKYLIIPNKFIDTPNKIDREIILKYTKNKLFYSVFFKEKKKAIIYRFKNLFRFKRI